MAQNDSKQVEKLEKLVEKYQKEQEQLVTQLTRYKRGVIALIITGLILLIGVYNYQEYRWNQKLQGILLQLKAKQ